MVEARRYSLTPEPLPTQDNRVQQSLEIVTDIFGVFPEDLIGKSNDPNSITARYVLVEALRSRNFGYKEIGSLLNNRTSNTIKLGLRRRHQYLMLHPKAKNLASLATERIENIWPLKEPSEEPIREDTLIQHTLLTVSQAYSVSIDEICGKRRKPQLIEPRFIIEYLLRKWGITLERIGDALGKRDHSSIAHGIKKIEKKKKNNSTFAKELSEIEDQIDAIWEKPEEEEREIVIQEETPSSLNQNTAKLDVSETFQISGNHETPQEETEIPKPDALDIIIATTFDRIGGDPSLLLNKSLDKFVYERTRLSQSCLIYFLSIAGISHFQISKFLNSSNDFVNYRLSHLSKKRERSFRLDSEVRLLKEELPWIKELLNLKKIEKQIGEILVFYTGISWERIISVETDKPLVYAQGIAIHLLRESGLDTKTTKRILGNMNPGKIHIGLSEFEKSRKEDPKLAAAIPIMESGVSAIVRRRELKEAIDRKIQTVHPADL